VRRALNGQKRYSGVLHMSFLNRAAATTLVLASVALVGCAGENGMENLFTTGSLGTQSAAAPEPKVDPACVSLASRIDALRKEGISEKIEKAAAKKYKMTQTDLNKADQLTKANADFQFRCSTIMPKSASAVPDPMPAPAPPPAAKAKAAKAASAASAPTN
jgi:hypothetical protein